MGQGFYSACDGGPGQLTYTQAEMVRLQNEIVLKRIAKKELIHRQTLSVGGAEFRGHGGGLPYLAAATRQRYDRVSQPRRKYLDYHPIDKQHPGIRDAANLFLFCLIITIRNLFT